MALRPGSLFFLRHRGIAAAFLAALAVAPVAAGPATEPPDNIAEDLAEAAEACKDFSGTPGVDAVLSTEDVNGDGGEDWIADYAKMKCAGGINPMCSSSGCTLQIYLWNGSTAWHLAFDEVVKSFQFRNSGGERLLRVVMSGFACEKPPKQTCTLKFLLQPDDIVPVQ